ncbi:MAG: hypothetical protein HOP20_08485 [Sulfuriferula sp.]|nr:hypothetical protein [Sulfuriferula sp.]
MSKAIDLAKHLFFGLAGLEFTLSAIQLTLKKADLQDIFVDITFKVLSLSFFGMLITERGLAGTEIPRYGRV